MFEINGYWKNDNETFEGYLVTDTHIVPHGYTDHDIFFHGLTEGDIQNAITLGENTGLDFVITEYRALNNNN